MRDDDRFLTDEEHDDILRHDPDRLGGDPVNLDAHDEGIRWDSMLEVVAYAENEALQYHPLSPERMALRALVSGLVRNRHRP